MIVHRESDSLGRYAPAFGRMLVVLERLTAAPLEIAVAGEDGAETATLLMEAHRSVHPSRVIGGWLAPHAAPDLPLFEGRALDPDRPTAWVCSGYSCRLPVHDAAALRRQVAEVVSTEGAPEAP